MAANNVYSATRAAISDMHYQRLGIRSKKASHFEDVYLGVDYHVPIQYKAHWGGNDIPIEHHVPGTHTDDTLKSRAALLLVTTRRGTRLFWMDTIRRLFDDPAIRKYPRVVNEVQHVTFMDWDDCAPYGVEVPVP